MPKNAVDTYIACPACDLLHRRRSVPIGTSARCVRCSTTLYSVKKYSPDRPLAFVLAGFALFVIANAFPFLGLEIEGRTQETILFSGIRGLYDQDQLSLAALVLLTGLVFPLLQLVGLTYVLVPLRFGVQLPHMTMVYRWVCLLQPWSMMEILMLGILVSLVKLAGMAGVVPGPALFAFMALIFTLPAAMIATDSDQIWSYATQKMKD